LGHDVPYLHRSIFPNPLALENFTMKPIPHPEPQTTTSQMHAQAGVWLLGMALVIEFVGLVVVLSALNGLV